MILAMPKKRIYMDNAATTPLDRRVLLAMRPYFSEKFGNPSSIHSEGVAGRKAVESARKSVAKILSARAEEIIFTSGGTESNNLAIFGVVKSLEKKGVPISKMHFITTAIEHSSILECFRELESLGAKVDYALVGEDGLVLPQTIAALLRSETVLVSVGFVNNEIGVVQPILKISKLLRNFAPTKPFFHSDGSQAPLYFDCSAPRLGVDLLTFDGHKMYGPKGVGSLYIRRTVPLLPILIGGGQERGFRSTTENVPGIVGFARAFEIAAAGREKESARLMALRDYFHSEVLNPPERTEDGSSVRAGNAGIRNKIIVNGSIENRSPNNVNISIPGLDTEFAVLKLDAAGIACSTKSSCLGSEGGSYVVRALGGQKERAFSTLRFTFGRQTAKKDIDCLIAELVRIINGR